MKSDFKTRTTIYKDNFSDIYKGTSKQNTELLKVIKKYSTKAKIEEIIKAKNQIIEKKEKTILNNNIQNKQVNNPDIQEKE
ncbi:MAG: hypothetical protein U9Q66_01755 [Patescibacteria group bacterium]|nr:hypothetical protein [Patescibacteria group bacterium]